MYFTLCMLVYIIIAAIVNVQYDTLLLEADRSVLFFVFSLMISAAQNVLHLPRPSGKIRVLIHFVITLFAVYTCFMLPLSMRASSVLVGMVIFAIVYFTVLGIVAAFRSKYRRNAEAVEKYNRQYSKK